MEGAVEQLAAACSLDKPGLGASPRFYVRLNEHRI
jgi:hypothetical protein